MALRELFARFGFEYDRAKLKEADGGVSKLKMGAEALVGVFAGSAILNATKHFAEQLDTLDDLSAQTGIATGDLQELGFAYELAGGSAEEMNASISLLQKSLGRTAEGTGPQVEALTKLGIKTKDAAGQGRSLKDVLPDVFANFSSLTSETEQAAVATALFGRQGVRLIPTLRKGSEGLKAIHDDLEEFGGVVGEDAITAAGEFKDNIARMDRAMFALKGRFATAVFPQLSKIITAFGKGVGRLSDWIKNTTLAETATKALAITIGAKLATALAPYLKSGLKFAAIFLAVDDVIGFLQGKDSLIGSLLDKAFGEGAQETVRAWVKSAAVDLGQMFSTTEQGFKTLEDSQASWLAAGSAGIGIFVRDAVAGFPLLKTSFEIILDGMLADIAGFVVKAITAWNSLLLALHLPDFLAKGLAIDPNAAVNAQTKLNQAQADRGAEFKAIEKGRNSNVFGTAAGGDVARGILAGGPQLTAQGAQFKAPFLTGAQPTTFAPLLSPQTTNITEAPLNVVVNMPAGTDPRDARAVGKAVGAGVRDATRTARQALVQRKE